MTLYEYIEEVADYLVKKLPDADPATLCEIVEYFGMKTGNYTAVKIAERDELWQKHCNKQIDSYNNLFERYIKALR